MIEIDTFGRSTREPDEPCRAATAAAATRIGCIYRPTQWFFSASG